MHEALLLPDISTLPAMHALVHCRACFHAHQFLFSHLGAGLLATLVMKHR